MKKLLLTMAAMLMLTACEKENVTETVQQTKTFRFCLNGDFSMKPFTRSDLTADGAALTDLWVFDFVDGNCVQSTHQTKTDEDFGQPEMTLDYGSHHIYFVASRGSNPTLDETEKTIVWGKPSDTFWKDYIINVSSASSGNISITLDRMVAKLKVVVKNEVPDGISTLSITPSVWYYGMNYTTGEPAEAKNSVVRSVSIPSSYIGTSGNLSMSIFGFSGTDEWTTNLQIDAKNGNGSTIGSVTIEDAPVKRNRVTECSGFLFGGMQSMSLAVNDEWDDTYSSEW